MTMTQSEKMVADSRDTRDTSDMTRDTSDMTQQPQLPKVRGFPSFDLKACIKHLVLAFGFACLLSIAFAEPGNTCNPETQFWVEHEDGSTSCEDCPSCPPGQTLSIECGKQILSSAMIKCEPCKPGMSFSSKHGTSVCTPCSSCAKDQVVLQNCTLTWDIKCDKRCYGKDRYYDDDKGDCFPCAKCCHDEQDVVENECKEKLGARSNMICSFDSSVNRCDKSTSFPQEPTSTSTNQSTTTNHDTSPSQGSKREHTVPPTAQLSHRDLLIFVSISVVILAMLIFAGYLYIRKARQMGSYLWCNCDTESGVPDLVNHASQNCGVHYKPTVGNLDVLEKGLENSDKVDHGILSTESMEPLLAEGNGEKLACSCQQDSKLLSSLLDDEPYLQVISECLDTTLAGAGNYRAVAQHYGLSHYKISSVLEKHERGPTTALIEWLAATHTELTVQEFAAVVRGKAKRNDVAVLLEAYDSNKNSGNP